VNTALTGELIRLRYKLLWAKTRSRNGRIALFLTGYLILFGVLALFTLGGLGAALLAVRSGKAETIARGVFGGIFIEAAFASNILGFGLNAIFSDLELRRYPLTASNRRIVRHLIGIVDPFWIIFLVLDLALAAGLAAAGVGNFGLGLIAVLLLFVCNYLFARLIAQAIDRIVQYRSGSAILMVFVLLLALGPQLLIQAFHNHPDWSATALRWLAYTPPFGAATATTHAGLDAVNGVLTILLWTFGLAVLLIRLENLAPVSRSAAAAKVEWESPYDRVASIFAPDAAPLVAHWLRLYLRHNRTRAMSVLALPLIAFLTYQLGRQRGPNGFFMTALGTFPMATFVGVARITVNQFGCLGGGFRRYLLLPSDPGVTLRTGSYVSLLIGAASIPVLLAGWLAFAPKPVDGAPLPAMLLMLASSAVAGLFLFHAAALWVSVINPRKSNYYAGLGNDLSLGGNILVIGSAVVAMLGPGLLRKTWPAPFEPQNWWMSLAAAALCVVAYQISLKGASAALGPRRERLLAVVEGRD